MIVGLFQRHYKIYRGASFLPFHANKPESLTAFIGNNGYGKSSVLEALDTYFNGRPFNINIHEKKSEAFVAPLIMLTADQFKRLPKATQSIVSTISDFLWTESLSKNPTNYNPYKEFFTYRDTFLSDYKDDHYLILLTKQYDQDSKFFMTFTNALVKKIEAAGTSKFDGKEFSRLNIEIKSLYSYIYIPVETSIEEFLKLETSGMQNLVDKKISDEINKVLSDKRITRNLRTRTISLSLLDIINENLEKYIDGVEKRIKAIDPSYDFRKEARTKKKLTANDLKEQIIYAYLSTRTLRKEKKSIKTLSAGERKKALVDIAYALLSDSSSRDRHIVMAIDEPESSLHISNCFEQFKRIEEMSLSKECQVIITTHWYGSLPLINKGTLTHLELDTTGVPFHTRFRFRNYFEDRKEHPDDVQLKSFYDLSSSIISSLRHYNTNWLIVEGSDDLNYISKFISTNDVNILPAGGCSIVKLLYDFLYVPLAHSSEGKEGAGKIMCLVDTDHSGPKLQHESETKSKKLMFRRLQIIGDKVELIRDERTERIPVEVEEVMAPKDAFACIQNVAKNQKDKDILKVLGKFNVRKDATYSKIKGDDSMLEYSGLAKAMKVDKDKLLEFIENNKDKISEEFTHLTNPTKPDWIKEVEDFFK